MDQNEFDAQWKHDYYLTWKHDYYLTSDMTFTQQNIKKKKLKISNSTKNINGNFNYNKIFKCWFYHTEF